MKPAEKIKSLFVKSNVKVSSDVDDRVINDVFLAFEKSKKLTPSKVEGTTSAKTVPNIWRIIMKSPITKLAAAAVIIITVTLGLTTILDKSVPTASAAEVLVQAAEAVANLSSVHIKAKMRAPGRGDNFRTIGLNYDFVPIEMWKQFNNTPHGKWKMENPGRVIVMDGEFWTMLSHPNYAFRMPKRPAHDIRNWFPKSLLDVQKIVERESRLAVKEGSDFQLTREQGEDGFEKLIIVVEAMAQGDFTNDYLKNKGIEESDNIRIYQFDAETKLLEDLEIYVHTENEDVLVFEITDIEYNLEITPALFELELPEDVIWSKSVEVLPDNEKYQQMTPKEMATAFFQACADEDWEEYLKFNPASDVSQRTKDYLGGLGIISIGEPFKSGNYPGWFVPYEIRLKNGEVRKHNLAIRKDNPAKRFEVDGGI